MKKYYFRFLSKAFLIFIFFITTTLVSIAQSWSNDYAGGVDNYVWELTIDGDNIYVGGDFTQVDVSGTGTNTARLGVWNKSTNEWTEYSDMGSNAYYVDEIVIDNSGRRYIGGFFNFNPVQPKPEPVNIKKPNFFKYLNPNAGIIEWGSGNNWATLSGGLKGADFGGSVVTGLASNGNMLYVGGMFHTVYNVDNVTNTHIPVSVGSIAQWNKTTSEWTNMQGGVSAGTTKTAWVYDIAVDAAGKTYVGGDFTSAGGSTANYIAVWNGSSWSTLGNGFNNSVRAIAVAPNGNVYMGGYFTEAVSASGVLQTVNHIVMWNGTSWVDLGGGVNGNVESIVVAPNGDVYVGGSFTTAGGISADNIAKWNGSTWTTLGSGTDGTVYALAVSGDDLFVGGAFTTAGGNINNYFAKYENINAVEGTHNCKQCLTSFSPIPGEQYVLSAWVKEDEINLTDYKNPRIIISFSGSSSSIVATAEGNIIDGWQRIEKEFSVPVDAKTIVVKLKNTGNNNVYFDDIRIYPFRGNMKSFVYDPVSLKLVAELDNNNYATFYEYDQEGKLVRVKKETERGIVTIKEGRESNVKQKK